MADDLTTTARGIPVGGAIQIEGRTANRLESQEPGAGAPEPAATDSEAAAEVLEIPISQALPEMSAEDLLQSAAGEAVSAAVLHHAYENGQLTLLRHLIAIYGRRDETLMRKCIVGLLGKRSKKLYEGKPEVKITLSHIHEAVENVGAKIASDRGLPFERMLPSSRTRIKQNANYLLDQSDHNAAAAIKLLGTFKNMSDITKKHAALNDNGGASKSDDAEKRRQALRAAANTYPAVAEVRFPTGATIDTSYTLRVALIRVKSTDCVEMVDWADVTRNGDVENTVILSALERLSDKLGVPK